MRLVLVLIVVTSFGCAELRYPARTQMVEVAHPVEVVAAPSPPRVRVGWSRERARGLVIGGTIASLIGGALIIGGAVGWKKQEADNAAADAQCTAQGGWFCGTFDNFSYAPYAALITIGVAGATGGVALLATGMSAPDRDRSAP